MGVHIDIGNPFDTVIALQPLDADGYIVENAKATGPAGVPMMQPADWQQGVAGLAGHYQVHGFESATDHVQGRFKAALESRGIAAIQEALAPRTGVLDK